MCQSRRCTSDLSLSMQGAVCRQVCHMQLGVWSHACFNLETCHLERHADPGAAGACRERCLRSDSSQCLLSMAACLGQGHNEESLWVVMLVVFASVSGAAVEAAWHHSHTCCYVSWEHSHICKGHLRL